MMMIMMMIHASVTSTLWGPSTYSNGVATQHKPVHVEYSRQEQIPEV
jgi:hypothetical protein